MGGTSSDRKARAEQMRKERDRAERRRRNLITGGIVGAAALLVAVAAIGIGMATDDGDSGGGIAFPTDAIVYEKDGASDPVDVIVYEDFQCPHCAAFDSETRDLVEEHVADGAVRVAYVPMNYLDQAMGGKTDYSLRAANAATCVYENEDGEAFHTFASALFDDQRPEGSTGFSDKEYVAYAKQAGATEIGSCLAKVPHEKQIAEHTRDFATSDVGQDGTPAVVVDGERLADRSSEAVRAAIEEAA